MWQLFHSCCRSWAETERFWWVFRMPRSLGNPQSDPLSSSPVGGLGRRGGPSYAVDGRRQSVFFFFSDCCHGNPRRKLVVAAVILILRFSWPPLPQLTLIHCLYLVLLVSGEKSHTWRRIMSSLFVFYPLSYAQDRLSAACRRPWGEQSDSQRAD